VIYVNYGLLAKFQI